MNIDVFLRSKLPKKDGLDRLLGVSRISLYHYLSGKREPSGDTAKRARRVELILEKLLDKGVLPAKDPDTVRRVVDKIQGLLDVPQP